MRLLIDPESVRAMRYKTTRFVEGETRHYFVGRDKCAIVVVRVRFACETAPAAIGNDALIQLEGKVVDAALGWDTGFYQEISNKAYLFAVVGADYDAEYETRDFLKSLYENDPNLVAFLKRVR